MKKIFIFILILISCLFIYLKFFQSKPRVYEFSDAEIPGLPAIPGTEEECLEAGGVWRKIGISPRKQCNLRTTDEGNGCIDSKTCESLCIADLTTAQINNLRKDKKPIETSGRCAGWRIVVGCHPVVIEGVVPGLMCID